MSLPPVIWKPTGKFGMPYKGDRGRALPILAVVYHRIVGTLPSADAVFADSSDRLASTHFGIGHVSGRLEIHQYVDLADAAWGNGDVREPTAQVVIQHPGVNPNVYTVSIEHEDGGEAGRGVVQPDTWGASLALSAVILSGDLAAIRAAGIHCRDQASADQLAMVPRDPIGLIDHHQIAGPNKPYCFRPWLDDPGFVDGSPSRRDELIASLTLPDTATEDDPMSWFADVRPLDPISVRFDNPTNMYTQPTLSRAYITADHPKSPISDTSRTIVGTVKGDEYPAGSGNVAWDVWIGAAGPRCYPSATRGTVTKLEAGASDADITQARTAGFSAAKSKARAAADAAIDSIKE